MLLFQRASALSTMSAAAQGIFACKMVRTVSEQVCRRATFYAFVSFVGAFFLRMWFFGAITLDMLGSSLAKSAAMGTLRDWTSFPVDVYQWTICSGSDQSAASRCRETGVTTSMSAPANAVAPDTSVACIFFTFDQHFGGFRGRLGSKESSPVEFRGIGSSNVGRKVEWHQGILACGPWYTLRGVV